MRWTSILRQQAPKVQQQTTDLARKTFNSLALTTYFKQPEFGMTEYEVLTRASAFLLAVDPPAMGAGGDGAYGHLDATEALRKMKNIKREKGWTPATPRPGSNTEGMKEMGWLEFAPREYRSTVHIVGSSHVVSPFLWTAEYYPMDWIAKIQQEHCRYALEIYDAPNNSIVQLDLNEAAPFHHPEGRDIAFLHFQDEEKVMPLLRKLGVQILHLRDVNTTYHPNEEVDFDGYAVVGPEQQANPDGTATEDKRVFTPCKQQGSLQYFAKDYKRFLAKTAKPLDPGMCGAPALDHNGRVLGLVEGHVSMNNPVPEMRGMASLLPRNEIAMFQEWVERIMLKALFQGNDQLFNLVVTAKKTNTIGGGVFKLNDDGKSFSSDGNYESVYQKMTSHLKAQFSKEEFDAVMAVMEEEKKEVQRIMKEEGGDLDEIMQRVRARTYRIRDMVHQKYKQRFHQDHNDGGSSQG